MMKFYSVLVLFLCLSQHALSAPRLGRLGIGMSSHLPADIQTLSLKLQKSRSTAIGGTLGLNSNSDNTSYALGLKVFTNIYEEPQLNFYSAASANIFTYLNTEKDKTEQGYLVDATFGAEFSFAGLESIGLSFEFGLGLSQHLSLIHI